MLHTIFTFSLIAGCLDIKIVKFQILEYLRDYFLSRLILKNAVIIGFRSKP